MITWQQYQNRIREHKEKNHEEVEDPSCSKCNPSSTELDPRFQKFEGMLAREVGTEIQSTGKAEEEFQKAVTAFKERYHDERIKKAIEAFRYDEEVDLKQLSQ
jgi:hypothetical protein